MIQEFLKLIQKTQHYSPHELQLLEKDIQYRKLIKNEILLQEGEVCKSFCFLVNGAIYQHKINEDFDQKILDLHTQNDWVLNTKSFTSQKPSESYITAYQESDIIEISVESIHKLIALSQSFLQMGKVLEQSNTRISFFDNDQTPFEKYQYILNNKPDYLQKFPQKMIASYLKITPETLSRVRNRFLKGEK